MIHFRLPKFDKSKIRVLIFRDCDKTGKNVLFDSDHAARVNNQVSDFIPISR